MDLELLNFFISDLKFLVKGNRLFLRLKACPQDYNRKYKLELSDDPDDILKFLGFDISIEYNKLTLRNQFEYLCTSTKLDPRYITYCGFKGPSPKDVTHSKFSAYLLEKYKLVRPPQKDTVKLYVDSQNWLKDAVSYFGKTEDYKVYEQQFIILTRLFEKFDELQGFDAHYDDFKRFVVLYGVVSVANWDDATVKKKWDMFTKINWSGLSMFTCH